MNVAIKLITVSVIMLDAVIASAIVLNVILLSDRVSCLNLNLIVISVRKEYSSSIIQVSYRRLFCTTCEHYN